MKKENNPLETTDSKLAKIYSLIDETREPYWKLGVLYVSVLTTILLFVGALDLFGVSEQTTQKLGFWGYLAVLFLSALVTATWFWGRKLYYYHLIVEELSNEPISTPDFLISLKESTTSRNFTNEVLFKISASPKNAVPFSDIVHGQENSQRSQTATIVGFLRDLGLLTIDEHLIVRPVSTWAGGFIRSMSYCIRDGLSLFGDWRSEGGKSLELKGIVTEIEKRRVEHAGGESVAEPSRLTKASIVIFKSKYKDNDVYLMQWSTAWSPRYWFIGGVMEPNDNSIQECAFRELNEELDLRKADIKDLRKICSVSDRRLSDRLGLLTEYDYHIFLGSLNAESERVRSLFRLEFEMETPLQWSTVPRKNKWITWEEIYKDPSLKKDASVILDKLNAIIKSEPLSSNLMVTE